MVVALTVTLGAPTLPMAGVGVAGLGTGVGVLDLASAAARLCSCPDNRLGSLQEK